MANELYDLATLGEAMLRISFPPGTALETATQADLHCAGAESNVAATLASLGRRTAWASRLPDSPPGRFVANALRRTGVDLSHASSCPNGRLGTFYVELSAPPTPVRVTYDRADSCAVQMTPESIDWDRLLQTRLLHLTGITPALSASCLATTQEAIKRAKAIGVPISFDVNYRRKLWSPESAKAALLPMLRELEILFIGESDAADVFGIAGTPESQIEAIRKLTPARHIVLSVGGEGTVAWSDGKLIRQSAQPTNIIDRLGAGDALAAGVLHGWLDGDVAAGLRAGAALAALCLRRHGDIVHCSASELTDLMQSTNGRPQR